MSGYLIALIICAAALIFLIRSCFRFPAKDKQTRRLRTVLILILSLILVFCALREFGPRGNNPLFGSKGAGENQGEDSKQGEEGAAEPAVKDGMALIIVTGDQVKMGSTVFEITADNDGGFALFAAKELGPGVSIRVIDSYAYAKAYRRVIEVLDGLGVDYIELSE